MLLSMIFILALGGSAGLAQIYDTWAIALDTSALQHVVSDQTLYWPLADQRTERTMELWFAPPNRFRVVYSKPDSQIVIADGSRIWTIVPQNEQVLFQDQDPTLSWRDTPLGELLSTDAKHCSCDSSLIDDSGGGELIIACSDFGTESPWVSIKLHVVEGEVWPSRAVLTDISENVTIYAIRSWEELPEETMNDSLFTCQIPSGYDVVSVE